MSSYTLGKKQIQVPLESNIFTYIYHKINQDVCKHTIHWSSGVSRSHCCHQVLFSCWRLHRLCPYELWLILVSKSWEEGPAFSFHGWRISIAKTHASPHKTNANWAFAKPTKWNWRSCWRDFRDPSEGLMEKRPECLWHGSRTHICSNTAPKKKHHKVGSVPQQVWPNMLRHNEASIMNFRNLRIQWVINFHLLSSICNNLRDRKQTKKNIWNFANSRMLRFSRKWFASHQKNI